MDIKDIGIATCEEDVIDEATRQKVWDDIWSNYSFSNDAYHDDITDDLLGTELVMEAIEEEMDTYHKRDVVTLLQVNALSKFVGLSLIRTIATSPSTERDC